VLLGGGDKRQDEPITPLSLTLEGPEEEEEEEEGNSAEEDEEEAASSSSPASRRNSEPPAAKTVTCTPEAVDDFLRNFLRRAGLVRTVSRFEVEWYGSALKRLTETLNIAAAASPAVFFIPDALTHRHLLQNELARVRAETELLREEVLAAGASLVRMQRERDFHRVQYQRVSEDKNKLIEDFKHLKKHLESYEPALKQLEDKYQTAVRQKTLLSLHRERLQSSTDPKPAQVRKERRSTSAENPPAQTTGHPKDSEFPPCSGLPRTHLAQVNAHTGKSPGSFSLTCFIRAHQKPISCIDLHPSQSILASASDDRTWRLWVLPAEGEQVRGGCVAVTLIGFRPAQWSQVFISDTCVLTQRCRLTLRRHTASVSSICFLPHSNLLLTCSADKTLALWDARLGICTATFLGHGHPCNHAAFTSATSAVASCDCRGVINLWDIRKPATPMAAVDTGPRGANQVAFSQSGKMLVVASSDGSVKLVEVDSGTVSSLEGCGDSVESVTFDHKGETVVSAGSDGRVNIWS
uniref:Uncharacterized protein n=1 Tax=Amphilophus citrinellus TaxID=61819 RepID=A0A3Q0S091_AMPCI